MLLDCSRLMEQKNGELPFAFQVPAAELIAHPRNMKFAQPVTMEGVLRKDEDGYELSGQAATQIVAPCDRCLTPVTLDIACSIQERFPLGETDIFSGNCMDLAEIVAAGILANVPMKVVCSEDCKGLCPICGKDRNTGDCGCDTAPVDPRFEQLRALFKLDEEV